MLFQDLTLFRPLPRDQNSQRKPGLRNDEWIAGRGDQFTLIQTDTVLSCGPIFSLVLQKENGSHERKSFSPSKGWMSTVFQNLCMVASASDIDDTNP